MRSPEEAVGELLRGAGATVAVAESCTGGLISHRLTNVPGSSDYFLCGFVTYGNRSKETVLGVAHETIVRHGAVSRETVGEMARGARRLAGATYALAASGVAGPGGGTAKKPVGLVFIALDSVSGTKVASYRFNGERSEVKRRAADAALRMLKEAVSETGP